MQNEPFISLGRSGMSPGGFQLDYRRVLHRARSYWFVIVGTLVIGLMVAYVINRYTTRIYPINASIIIRQSEENTNASILYSNPLINQYRNYFNELYIIESYPIIQGVIEDLNFHVRIQKEGNFKTTEQYNVLPITIKVLTPSAQIAPTTLTLRINDERTFSCLVGDEKDSGGIYHFGDTTDCNGNRLIVRVNGDVSKIIGERYIVSISRPESVATSYISSVNLSWAAMGSSVVNISIESAIPQKGIDFVSRLISNYQTYDLEKKIQASSRSIKFIEDQLDIIRDSLSRYERELMTFKHQNILTDLSQETANLYEELKELDAQKMGLVISASYYDYLEKYIDEANSLDKVVLPSTIGITDPILDALVTQMMETQSGIKTLGNKDDTKNPLINIEKNKLIESKNRILESVHNLRITDGIKWKYIDQQIAKLESELGEIPAAERLLANIKRKYAFAEGMYTFLTQKLAEAGISKASTTSDIVVVNPPRVSGGAITPKIMQNYIVFGGSGLLVPMIVFVLLEVLNTKIQSKDDIATFSSIPFLGGIGHKTDKSNLVVFNKPKSSIAESFRALRSNLNFFLTGTDKQVILITSSISGEGKTFSTVNLAAVYALMGKKTIIIGADLRKPKIYSDFGLSNQLGLSTYLANMATIPEIIQATENPNLFLISGGPAPPNPSELILDQRMDALITELKKTYDYLFIDTPPIALIADGFALNRFADHTIYIVRQNYTPIDMIRSASELYLVGRLSKVSIVLNDIQRSGLGYGYTYGYSSYGYYGGDRRKSGESYYEE